MKLSNIFADKFKHKSHGRTIFNHLILNTLLTTEGLRLCTDSVPGLAADCSPPPRSTGAGRGGAGTEPGGAERRNVVAAGKSINLFFAEKQRA